MPLPRSEGGKPRTPEALLKFHAKQAVLAVMQADKTPTEITVRIGDQEFPATVTVNAKTGKVMYHFGGKGFILGERVNVGGNIMTPWDCPGFAALKARYWPEGATLDPDSEAALDAGEST